MLIREKLEEKIRVLSRFVWEGRAGGQVVADWVSQFSDDANVEDSEQLHALFLLSHFLYFGQDELRFLLKSLYRDYIRAPMLRAIRRENANTMDLYFVEGEYCSRLERVRFLPVGNPSESGAHILYYFRQENSLAKALFVSSHQIFDRTITDGDVGISVQDENIQQYIFIDDLCGSGNQVGGYCANVLESLKVLAPGVTTSYFTLFGTTQGLDAVRAYGMFDDVGAVFELDASFRAFDPTSRIFGTESGPFALRKVRATCEKYGGRLWSEYPLGYADGQLAIGFNYNTPDNSLPIFWGGDEAAGGPWRSVFRRYPKVY